MVLEVHIVGVVRLFGIVFEASHIVVVDLPCHVRGRRERMRPSGERIGAGYACGFRNVPIERTRKRHARRGHVDLSVVNVSLEGQSIGIGPIPVATKPGLKDIPVIAQIVARGTAGTGRCVGVHGSPRGRPQRPVAVEVLGVNPEVGAFAYFAAVADRAETQFFITDSRAEQCALSLLGFLGDDVDDAVDRIGAPKGPGWSSNHFDAVDVFQHDVLGIPEHAGVLGVVDAAAVDQHEQFVGELALESPGGNGPAIGIDPGDLDARHHPQSLRNTRGTRATNIFLGEHVNGRGGIEEPLFLLRYRGDFDVHQVFQGQIEKITIVDGRFFSGRD